MTKVKNLITLLFIAILLFILPTASNANTEVSVTRNIYSNNASMKFNFSGLTLDTTHEYEFGLTRTAAAEVENWYLITEYTASTATVDIMTTTDKLREVINAVDTGYVTIKDKTSDTIVLQPYGVDLKIPYLKLTNYTVIPNGKKFGHNENEGIQIALRNDNNSEAYFQYEKITDQNVINKYKEIKANNGDFSELQSMLKTTVPNSNWSTWGYFNGHSGSGMNSFGYPQRTISVPDTGLYYMWLYFSGDGIKNMYGCILVDNLAPDIALESISLPKTRTVELGKTLTLSPTFTPTNATNKIVTWSSSDETVATVDNAGKVTPIKVGSTIITVTSEDGNRKATCTVTVTEPSSNNPGTDDSNNGDSDNENPNGGNTGTNGGTNNDNNSSTNDDTSATVKFPQTGLVMTLTISIIVLTAGAVFAYFKYSKLKDI